MNADRLYLRLCRLSIADLCVLAGQLGCAHQTPHLSEQLRAVQKHRLAELVTVQAEPCYAPRKLAGKDGSLAFGQTSPKPPGALYLRAPSGRFAFLVGRRG